MFQTIQKGIRLYFNYSRESPGASQRVFLRYFLWEVPPGSQDIYLKIPAGIINNVSSGILPRLSMEIPSAEVAMKAPPTPGIILHSSPITP